MRHCWKTFCCLPRRQGPNRGCIGYEIYENSRDSSRILIFETWRDAASLEAHQQTEHFRLRAPRNRELSETSVLSRFSSDARALRAVGMTKALAACAARALVVGASDQYFTLIHGAFSASQPLTSIGTSVHM